MAPSLQEIHKRRRQQHLVAREEQLAHFRENLGFELEDERRRFILNVFGQGGVGKTTLLKVYQQLALETGWLTALADRVKEELPEVINDLATGLDASGKSFKDFREEYERFLRSRQELEADPEYMESFAGLAGSVASRAGLLLARRAAGGLLDEVDIDAVGDKGRDLGAFLARKFKGDKKSIQLMRDPVGVLTPLFLRGVSAAASEQPTALFFDEYERRSEHLDGWLRDLLNGRYGEVPGNSLLVIAGRNELERNAWAPFEDLIARISLEPFGEEEARQFLAGKGIRAQEVVDLILELSGGLPLLLATLAAGEPSDIAGVGAASDTAVDRFLSWVEERERKELAIDAAAPRLINRDIVAELVRFGGASGDPETLFDWLVKMPFIVQRSDGWAYHDLVRQQMIRHARRRSPSRWQELQSCLAGFFARCRDDLGVGEKKQKTPGSTWQSFHLEYSYHRLCADQRRLPEAVSGFLDTLKKQQRVARRWASLIYEAGKDCDIEELERWGSDLGEMATEGATEEKSVQVLDRVICDVQLDAHDLCTALELRAITFFKLGSFRKALQDLDQVLTLTSNLAEDLGRDEREAKTLLLKGVTLAWSKVPEEAIAVYDDVVKRYGERDELPLQEQVAWALVNKGVRLGALARSEEEIAVYDEVVKRYGERDELPLQEPVARALVNMSGHHLRNGSQYDPDSEERLRHLTLAEDCFTSYAERTGKDLKRIYNYACFLALRGDSQQALSVLEACLEDKTISIEHVQKDPDWDTLRSLPQYLEIVQRHSA